LILDPIDLTVEPTCCDEDELDTGAPDNDPFSWVDGDDDGLLLAHPAIATTNKISMIATSLICVNVMIFSPSFITI
jgi:hypothetical protein